MTEQKHSPTPRRDVLLPLAVAALLALPLFAAAQETGGDAKAGREIFAEKAEAACMRCHKVKGEGGDVGPDLAGISAKHDRAYLLQSIVEPNAVIAPGFDNVLAISPCLARNW